MKFISIEATRKNRDIQIDWEVAEENGIQKYEIHRSADGINFTKAAEVMARENNSSETYSWLDDHPITGNNYYYVRAKQADGRSFVTKIVVVEMTAGKPVISVFPNPVKNKKINIRADELEKGKYTLLLHNQHGQEIMRRVIDHPGGLFNHIINPGKNSMAGVYYLQLTNEKLKYSQTILID